LYFISVSFTLLEGQYLLFSLSTIACIVSALSIKGNWNEMQKDKQAMYHASPK
jgi:hypothetical protein